MLPKYLNQSNSIIQLSRIHRQISGQYPVQEQNCLPALNTGGHAGNNAARLGGNCINKSSI